MNASSWYCQINGQSYGPYTFEQLRQFAVEGRIVSTSLVCQAGGNAWLPASAVPGLIGNAAFPNRTMSSPSTAMGPMAPVSMPGFAGSITTGQSSAPFVLQDSSEAQEKTPRKSSAMTLLIVAIGAILLGGLGCWLVVLFTAPPRHAVAENEMEEEEEVDQNKAIDFPAEKIRAALDGIKKWTDTMVTTKLGTPSYHFDLAGIWSPKDSRASNGERMIYVLIKVQNPVKSGKPLSFTSWNRPATFNKMPTALMLDSEGHLCPLAPNRVHDSGDEDGLLLQPGQETSDVVAFKYPKQEFDYVHLAFSYEAVDQGKRYFGYKIPRSMINDSPPSDMPTQAASVRKLDGGGNREPTLEEINRQAERDVQREKERRKKELANP